MAMKFYFRDMEGYKDLTEHQKKYVGKSAVFDLDLLPVVTLQEEMAEFIQERIRTVAMTTLLNDRGNYNLLCRFLEKRGKGLELWDMWNGFWIFWSRKMAGRRRRRTSGNWRSWASRSMGIR